MMKCLTAFALYSVLMIRFHFSFFFSSRRRHTRCLSDWSSDVCSSDLLIRLSEYTTDKCFICSTKKNSEHLIFHYKVTRKIRNELKQEFDIKEFFLKNFFNIKSEQDFLRSEERRVGKECKSQ